MRLQPAGSLLNERFTRERDLLYFKNSQLALALSQAPAAMVTNSLECPGLLVPQCTVCRNHEWSAQTSQLVFYIIATTVNHLVAYNIVRHSIGRLQWQSGVCSCLAWIREPRYEGNSGSSTLRFPMTMPLP